MKYLSVCDGIGAAHQAWKPLGWRCVGASEIEKFPIAVVEHHHPEINHLGDMTKHHEWNIEAPDLICGGTPCQSFSVAGLRAGLADPRGNLALVFLGIVDRYRPKWVVWENVPGVYSATSHEAPDPDPPSVPLDVVAEGNEVVESDDYDADEDHAFACFLAGLSELGYGACYRSLDAQYAGVPQRRRRVFVVGYLGDWRPSAAVLFEPQSLSGHPAPRRRKGEGSSADVAPSLTGSGRGVERAGESRGQDPVIAHALRADGFDASEDGTGRGTPLVPETMGSVCAHGDGSDGRDAYSGRILPIVMAHGQGNAEIVSDGEPSLTCNHEAPILAFKFRGGGNSTGERGGNTGGGGGTGYLGQEECAFTVATSEDQMVAVPECSDGAIAFKTDQEPEAHGDLCPTLQVPSKSGGGQPTAVMHRLAVRRLTPRECERLQSFQVRCQPDTPGAWQDEAGRWWTEDYTAIPWRGKPASECPDGPRYKALGNSWCVNEVHWIGRRIQLVDDILKSQP